jgi:hypothetical protein
MKDSLTAPDPACLVRYPGPRAIPTGRPLVIVEAESDAQAITELAVMVTMGGASSGPERCIPGRMLPAGPWFIATDADAAGEKTAAGTSGPRSVQGLDRGPAGRVNLARQRRDIRAAIDRLCRSREMGARHGSEE